MYIKEMNSEGKSKFKALPGEAVKVPGDLRLPDIKTIHP
jgi:hypothetical protein